MREIYILLRRSIIIRTWPLGLRLLWTSLIPPLLIITDWLQLNEILYACAQLIYHDQLFQKLQMDQVEPVYELTTRPLAHVSKFACGRPKL